jgi:hypothetical protein
LSKTSAAAAAPIPAALGPSDACVTALFPNIIDDIADLAPLVVDAARRIAATATV